MQLAQTLEKEKFLNEDPKWNDTNYVLINYKTEQCKRPPRLCRQGFACPQYHNARDKRRNPSLFKYRSTPCPNVKQGDDWLEPSVCENGDSCKYCHSRTEQQFHPEIYKSSKCNDMISTGYCPRGPFCAFAHVEQELKTQRTHSTSESSSSEYTLENFITSGLPTSVSSNLKEEANAQMQLKPIGSERPAKLVNTSPSLEETGVNTTSSTSSSSTSPTQQQQQQQDLTINTNNTNTDTTGQSSPLQTTRQASQSAKSTPTGGAGGATTSVADLANLVLSNPQLSSALQNSLVGDLEKEKLRQDLLRQTELSSKLETLCLQYRQVCEILNIIKIFQ